MSPGTLNPPTPTVSWRRDLLLLALIFGALYSIGLGRAPLSNPDEGRYAEIPREMIATGDWVTPRLDGVNYFEKPPLMYWAVAADLALFGPGEWSLRMVPAVFGLGGVLFAYAAGRRLCGRDAGLWSALVLGTSLFYFALSRFLILDLAVSVLMSAALFCFILALREPAGRGRRWLFYGLYASAALATLTKGLMGFLIPGAVMFLWLLGLNQWKRLRPLYLPTGLPLFLALALPWHLLVAARNPTWAHRYLVYEHWERFTTPAAGRHGAWWYFIPFVVLGIFPWTGFLYPAVRDRLAGGWARRAANAEAWFLAFWAGFVFLFFSYSQSKLAPYILPVFPPLAVLTGAGIASALRRPEGRAGLRAGLGTFLGLCGLLAAAVLVAIFRPGLVHASAEQIEALRPHAFRVAMVLLAGGGMSAWLWRKRGEAFALGGVLLTTVFFFGALAPATGHIQRPGTKELALIVRARARPGDRVLHYHEFFHDFTFYSERTVGVVAYVGELEPMEDAAARASGRFLDEKAFRRLWDEPGRVFAVARKKDVLPGRDQPAPLFGDPTFRYHLIGETEDHYLFSNQP